MFLSNDICNVTIDLDNTYTPESRDNKNYDIVLKPDEYDYFKTFSIEINLFLGKINIALIGDYNSFIDDCAILDNNILSILQGNRIIQIKVNDGSLVLNKHIESCGVNFGIYKIKTGYIIYGEEEILKLDFKFDIEWRFQGKEIFVSKSNKNPFKLCEKTIKLYDFQDNYYEIDYNGKLIN